MRFIPILALVVVFLPTKSSAEAPPQPSLRQRIRATTGIELARVELAVTRKDADAQMSLLSYAKRVGMAPVEKMHLRAESEKLRGCAGADDRLGCEREIREWIQSEVTAIRNLQQNTHGIRGRLYAATLIFAEHVSTGLLDPEWSRARRRCARRASSCAAEMGEIQKIEDALMTLVETARGKI